MLIAEINVNFPTLKGSHRAAIPIYPFVYLSIENMEREIDYLLRGAYDNGRNEMTTILTPRRVIPRRGGSFPDKSGQAG
jgi:hypothetical protein